MQIFESVALDGKRATAFDIKQELHDEKTFQEWAEYFCEKYFSETPNSENVFLLNTLTQIYCDALTLHAIDMSSIDRLIIQ